MFKNYYLILGVAADATLDEVRAAFRRRALELHPDRSGLDSGPFLELQEAYGVLSDPARRRSYDHESGSTTIRRRPWGPASEPLVTKTNRRRSEPLSPVEIGRPAREISLVDSFRSYHPSFEAIIDRLLGNFQLLERPKGEALRSLTVEVILDPEEAKLGRAVFVRIPAQATCPNCGGRGSVGAYECLYCQGHGGLSSEYPVEVAYPPGINDGYVVQIPLDQFGINNFFLTVVFRVSFGW